jgi:Zn-dependent protease with chaperone function
MGSPLDATDATALPLICPQGHGPGQPGSLFCTLCGAQLVVPLAPPTAPAQSDPAESAQPYSWSSPATWASSVPSPFPSTTPPVCKHCGGEGLHLDSAEDVCPECAWLRPLFPGYELDRSVFLWAQDGQAMSTLHKMSALSSIARTASDKVGRPWIEATYNGIRIGPNQLPNVWKLAVLAGRLLGMPRMPDVYVSGDSMWNTYTFGSDSSSFIVLGTAILTNFHGDDLLFVLAREMGHCRAGHALWKTVIRFVAGDIGIHSGILSGGMLSAISPTKLIGSALEMPLMAWSRQSDITADRAGLLAVGDVALARRVLLSWSIRSATLLKQVNMEEWMKQEEASADQLTHISEMTTSSSMYTARRLRLLGMAAREPELMRWSQTVQPARQRLESPPQPATTVGAPSKLSLGGIQPQDSLRIVCTKCNNAMRVPLAVLRGKTSLNVRCPQCQNVITLRQKPAVPTPPTSPQK